AVRIRSPTSSPRAARCGAPGSAASSPRSRGPSTEAPRRWRGRAAAHGSRSPSSPPASCSRPSRTLREPAGGGGARGPEDGGDSRRRTGRGARPVGRGPGRTGRHRSRRAAPRPDDRVDDQDPHAGRDPGRVRRALPERARRRGRPRGEPEPARARLEARAEHDRAPPRTRVLRPAGRGRSCAPARADRAPGGRTVPRRRGPAVADRAARPRPPGEDRRRPVERLRLPGVVPPRHVRREDPARVPLHHGPGRARDHLARHGLTSTVVVAAEGDAPRPPPRYPHAAASHTPTHTPTQGWGLCPFPLPATLAEAGAPVCAGCVPIPARQARTHPTSRATPAAAAASTTTSRIGARNATAIAPAPRPTSLASATIARSPPTAWVTTKAASTAGARTPTGPASQDGSSRRPRSTGPVAFRATVAAPVPSTDSQTGLIPASNRRP